MPPILSLLIVDDSEAERELIAHTLRVAFPQVELRFAAHPLLAPQMCRDHAFDCVLLDYNMPEMDGLMLARQLRAADAYLPIILATSVGNEMLVAEALRSGVSDYIPKARIAVESIGRIVRGAVHACSQARLIDEQRRELENFAFALAHDFKQPIRQIITFSQMVSDEVRSGKIDDVERHLAFLGDAAGRLGRLVDVMSQYTLLNQPPELDDVDLNRVIAAVRASLSPYLEERAAEFVSPAHAPTVRGNETLMIQILENLTINGLKYNTSAVPRVEMTALCDDAHCVLTVSDNGIGIEAEYLAEIFNPLVRLHTSAQYAGSGLGLTLARKAALSQAGALWCESVAGKGSAFHLRLPATSSGLREMDAPSASMEPAL